MDSMLHVLQTRLAEEANYPLCYPKYLWIKSL